MTIPTPLTLYIAIDSGDIPELKFDTVKELIDYILLLDKFDCVWLFTTESETCEIVVTQSLEFICNLLGVKSFHNGNSILYLQEYPTYEEAYAIALEMREQNPKTYM